VWVEEAAHGARDPLMKRALPRSMLIEPRAAVSVVEQIDFHRRLLV
jgi:hypothetical protein